MQKNTEPPFNFYKIQSDYDDDSSEESNNHNEKQNTTVGEFKCLCGKVYQSLSAANTHNKNKHLNQQKYYNQNISKPKKDPSEQREFMTEEQKKAGKKRQLRFADIKYDQMQVQLQYLAQKASQSISNQYQNAFKNKKQKEDLIKVEYCCAEDYRGERAGILNRKVHQLSKHYNMGQIIKLGIDDIELKTFKTMTMLDELNLIYELRKYFKTDFAVKIDVSLKIIHVYQKKQLLQSCKQEIQKVLSEIWKEVPLIKEILFCYYIKWDSIRFHLKQLKQKNYKKLRKVI